MKLTCLILLSVGTSLAGSLLFSDAVRRQSLSSPDAYLGFDRNVYPGDQALPVLRKTFSFTSYWLGPPPGERQSSWHGKRTLLESHGFGFVVLFSGRQSRNLKDPADAREKGFLDAQNAVKLAHQEGFEQGTLIFLDIEEGGRLPPSYHNYLHAWIEELSQAGYRAGVYGSAMPVDEGHGVTMSTALDIQDHLGSRDLAFWVYNDRCPPSPGCAFSPAPPGPAEGGFSRALIWQYAQSPRRKAYTAKCPAKYASDGNCYAPGDAARNWFLDVNTAASPNPSSPR
jgi:hypothetical protein